MGKHKKDKGEEGKKKKMKRERKVETSEDEAAAPLEEDLSDSPSDIQMDDPGNTEAVAKAGEKAGLDDKVRQKKGKWEVKLQGIDLVHDKKNKKDGTQKDSLQKLKGKQKEDAALQSDSSDSSTLHKRPKNKTNESTSAAPKVLSSSTSSSSSSSSTAVSTNKPKEEEGAKEDPSGSTNLFDLFLLNCEAKDRAPRRPAAHQPAAEKSSSKPSKIIGKIEKIAKPAKESPSQKPELEKTERTKQSDVSRPSQSYGFALDSDEREEDSAGKTRPADEFRERKEKLEEALRSSWEKKTPSDDRRKRRNDSEPRLFLSCDENQEPAECTDKSGSTTLSLGMDLNLDWMTLEDFQKHLNGEDELLSGPSLLPSELRDAVKCGDYMAVKLALNSKEDYNLEQEACPVDERRSFEGERSLIEERSSNGPLTLTSNIDSARNEDSIPAAAKINVPQDLDCPKSGTIPSCPASTNTNKMTIEEYGNIQESDSDIIHSKEIAYDTTITQISQEEENQQIAETNNSFNVYSALSGNKDEIEQDQDDGTEPKSMAAILKSAKQASDLSNEGECGLFDSSYTDTQNTDQVSSTSSTEEMVKNSHHWKKTTETGQEIPSSLKTCKNILETEPTKEDKNIKKPCIKHFCFYCKMAFNQLAKHLENDHSGEIDVAHAIRFPKGSKVRQTLLDQICNKGDYEHNCKVVKSGEGEILVNNEAKKQSISVCDFLPCKYCFAFYRKIDLWRHEQSCKVRKEDQKCCEKTNETTADSAFCLLPVSEFLTGSCKDIINVMHQDDIARHIGLDPLICKYGTALSTKYNNDQTQFAYIAQKMRELGRFVLAVNELDRSVKYLHEICLPSKFELAIEGVKKVSGFDPCSSKFKTISLVSKIGYSLKRAAEIAFGESRMKEDSETESEIKQFIHLLDTKWSKSFSHKALSNSFKQGVKKVEVDKSTVTEDLMKLHRFVTGEENEARNELKERPSLSTWKKLSEATLANVCLFNRGRVGNIGRLLLKTYTERKSRGTFIPSSDQVKKSTKLESDLSSRFTILELEGQYGRNMLVMLTARMVSSIDLLVENREQAGVSKTNPYLFARTEGPSFIRGLDCFRRSAVECGVKNPGALLSSSLREQIACCWQLMSLSEPELDHMANMLGWSSLSYNLSRNAFQLEEVSKQLLKMDQALPPSSPNTTKDGTQQKPALKRKPWNEMEQSAVKRYLSDFITRMKVPGKKECNACIAAEPDLGGRSWTDVKNYVHNTLQTIRRRNNQQTPGGNNSVLSSKNVKASVLTKNAEVENTSDVSTMATVNPDHLLESCMSMPSPTNMNSSSPYPQDMTASYSCLGSTSRDILYTGQPLISTFSPLNATDTQVVPTFTPHNTTNTLIPRVYTSENSKNFSMSSLYTQNPTCIFPPSVFTPQDTTSSPMIPSFTKFNVPSTSTVPTYTQLNTPSTPIVSAFLALNDRSLPIMSSFTPLNQSNVSAFHTSPFKDPTTAQVVPSVHGHSVTVNALVAQESTPVSSPGKKAAHGEKPQKRTKRLWTEEEQAAVRRQLGEFCMLVKVPGKKDCDACLAAEPALSTRTWREVKYFVHNSIQSLKRRGHVVASKESGPQDLETQSSSAEWDAPVYLSL
uniref:Si:ch73-269m14.4 n=2 Tax=Nothobranchius korthausae TaxID=1143690 RepID=A0A1A8FUQ7_9TELE